MSDSPRATGTVAGAAARAKARNWAALEGVPWPLGVTWIEADQAFNFAVVSAHATSVTLLLYVPADVTGPCCQVRLDPIANKSGPIWHCRLRAAQVQGASYYAYFAEGPMDSGHRFDPQKVLCDPYARALYFPPAFSRQAARSADSTRGRAPLGRLPQAVPSESPHAPRGPRHSSNLVIYELHVRGFTRRANSGVSAATRGTYAGVIEKIPYLQALGVTAVELLPVFQRDPQDGNYWGYVPLSFFAPHAAYAATPAAALEEFRAMVSALHAANLEVILDVVYNHTAEDGDTGPTYSFRGLDNETYYLLLADHRRYRNDSGAGNTLNCANPHVRRLILDSLEYWVSTFGVDGFRFDLASIFSRQADGSINLNDPPLLDEISHAPSLQGVRLIAEPWDVEANELGEKFPGTSWQQWNAAFRDDLRRFVRGDPGMVPRVMTRLYGSPDLFPDDVAHAYHSYQSVNFVTSHDGYCLRDLVSYSQKRNQANGEDNRDGAHENWSWNCGWEGDDGAPAEVMALRKRQIKNYCALLCLANGTPMFCAGDEFMQTQLGNNNPYNQDNATTWLDWDLIQTHADILRFFTRMIAFRKAHPTLGRSRFWRSDVRWFGPTGPANLDAPSRALAWSLNGQSQEDDDLYVMVNAAPEPTPFLIGDRRPQPWRRVVDTGVPSPEDILEPGAETQLNEGPYVVAGRSLVVLIRARAPESV